MQGFNRREGLKLMGAGALTYSVMRTLHAQAAGDNVFAHGVASGDPDHSSVVLWTRVSGKAEYIPVTWEVARDEGFSDIVDSGKTMARPSRDYTVKVLPAGLDAGSTYYYRFVASGESSPVGRTRTLPQGELTSLGFAVASCTNYPFGYFNAYDAIAKDDKVDFVFHAGDYIYEYGADSWGSEVANEINRVVEPAHEMVTLRDYRMRHALYKTDNGSRAMHAAHPLIACWDDHEVTNDPWQGGAQNHQPDTEGEWETRRAAALQAYYEYMPIREPDLGGSREAYWRVYEFGDLATFVMLETRHSGRDEKPPYVGADDIQSEADYQRYMTEVVGDPDRQMLSPELEQITTSAIQQSVSQQKPWQIIGAACPFARWIIPDIGARGFNAQNLPDGIKYLVFNGKWGIPWYIDTWDGYPVAREKFYDMTRDAGAEGLLVLTGDSHNFWANELYDDEGRSVGVELSTTGISSPPEWKEAGLSQQELDRLDAVLIEEMPEVHWCNASHNGYIRCEIGPEHGVASFIAVSTVLERDYDTELLYQTRIVKKDGSLAYESIDT